MSSRRAESRGFGRRARHPVYVTVTGSCLLLLYASRQGTPVATASFRYEPHVSLAHRDGFSHGCSFRGWPHVVWLCAPMNSRSCNTRIAPPPPFYWYPRFTVLNGEAILSRAPIHVHEGVCYVYTADVRRLRVGLHPCALLQRSHIMCVVGCNFLVLCVCVA